MDQAREYKTLLESNDIPATIVEQNEHVVGSREIASPCDSRIAARLR
jgi:hypothetical protein